MNLSIVQVFLSVFMISLCVFGTGYGCLFIGYEHGVGFASDHPSSAMCTRCLIIGQDRLESIHAFLEASMV